MSILEEARRVIQERQQEYGSRQECFGRIAAFWSIILKIPVTPEQVALCMIGLKLARFMFSGTRDSLVDIAGYAQCLEELGDA